MKEAIKMLVMNRDTKEECEIVYDPEDSTLQFFLNGQAIFYGDWELTFFPVFKRALELWQGYLL